MGLHEIWRACGVRKGERRDKLRGTFACAQELGGSCAQGKEQAAKDHRDVAANAEWGKERKEEG